MRMSWIMMGICNQVTGIERSPSVTSTSAILPCYCHFHHVMKCTLCGRQPWPEGNPVGRRWCRVRRRVDWLLHEHREGWSAHSGWSQEGHSVGAVTRRTHVRDGREPGEVRPGLYEHHQVTSSWLWWPDSDSEFIVIVASLVFMWDPLRTRAIYLECLRGVFTTNRYTNLRSPLPSPLAPLSSNSTGTSFPVTSSRTCWGRRQLPRNKLATSYEEVGDVARPSRRGERGWECWRKDDS